MQCKRVQHQIMGLRIQRQHVVICDNRGLGEFFAPEIGLPRDDRDRFKGSVNLFESFMKFISDDIMQEERVRQGARAVARKRCAIG